MGSQLAEQAAHRTRAERNIGQIRIAANRQRRVVARRKSKAGLIEPVPDQGFQMLAAADAPRVFLALPARDARGES
jgi:hypothetical protein